MSVHFTLKWQAGARPPVHPKPMVGEQCFSTIDKLIAFVEGLADDAQIISATKVETIETDLTRDVRAALAGAA